MYATNSAQMHVEVDLDSDPIAGRLCADGATIRRFSGWTELFASLEATLADLRTNSSAPRDDMTATDRPVRGR
jgi:hypothetical protein